jgi:hypothetical protein
LMAFWGNTINWRGIMRRTIKHSGRWFRLT